MWSIVLNVKYLVHHLHLWNQGIPLLDFYIYQWVPATFGRCEAPLHCFNPGQPAGKGQEKKNPGPDLGVSRPRLSGPGQTKKKKNPGINPDSPSEKGGKKKPWSRSGFQDLDFQDLKPRIGTSTDRQMDGQTSELIKQTSGCPWPKATMKPLREIQVPKLRSHILKITS